MALTVGSLFSGIGGIDLGLERAGMVTRWFCETDPHCRNVLARHWPGLPIYGDITTVDWSGVEPVDVLAGGFPCQPISGVGQQLAQSDDRWLWPEFERAVRRLRPTYVLVENVSNLLAVNDGSAMGEVVGDLACLGYDAEWEVVPASGVGAPHERDRLWIVAYAQGTRLEGHGLRGVFAAAGRVRSNAAQSSWWSSEPDVGRVAHGVPHRVDRLRSLGNAVVPQVVEWIGRRIVAFDESREVSAA